MVRYRVEPKRGPRRAREAGGVVQRAPSSRGGQRLRDEMDEILEEIDAVLEENTEEFVAGFAQRSGQ